MRQFFIAVQPHSDIVGELPEANVTVVQSDAIRWKLTENFNFEGGAASGCTKLTLDQGERIEEREKQ